MTLGIGGNDVKFGEDIAADCISLSFLANPSCKPAVDRVVGRIPRTEAALTQAIQQIHARSPQAQVFMVNYLTAIPTRACWPIVPIAQADMTRVHSAFAELNAMVGRAANAGGAHLVDTYSQSGGHDFCRGPSVRWVEGLIPISLNDPALLSPFHPNSAGASAQARFVLGAVNAVPPLTTTTTTTMSTSTTTTTAVPLTTEPVTDATPPENEPPVTEPPPTDPPTTQPPATEPPATEPPTTEPPGTEPPTTEPPAGEPLATEPPVQ